jgi:hypothetical protein
VPSQQRLGRDNGCHFREHLSSEQTGFGCQVAALVVSKAKPAAQLSTKDPVLFTQILDRVLLLLIHLSSDRNEHKWNGSNVFGIV